MTASMLATTQYRLARHYLNKLRTADAAVRRGQASVAHGVALFDQEWEQIRHWQAWAAGRRTGDEESAQLCKEFPLAGIEVLSSRISAADHVGWLKAALESAQQLQDGEAERTLYHHLGVTYYRLGELDQVEHLAKRLLALGDAAHDPLSSTRAVLLLGVFAEERGRYDESQHHYQRALELSMQLGIDDEIARALNGLGAIAFYRGDYEPAYHHLTRQLELMEGSGQKNKICHALISLGRVLIGLKEYAQAEECLLQAVNMCRLFGYSRLLGVGLLNLGLSAERQNQLEAARSYIEEGIQAVRSTNTQRQIVRGLTMLGDIETRLGDPSAALAHLQEGLHLAQDAGLPRHICDLQQYLVHTFLAMNDLDAARCALRESLTLAWNMDSHPQKSGAVASAIAYFQRLGLNEQAAVLAGAILGDTELDQAYVTPIYRSLEAALGSSDYHSALERGKEQTLDDAVAQTIRLLA